MEWLKLIIEIALGVFLIDRIGLWLEERGWLYWRKKRPSGGGAGNALQGFEAFFRPSAKHAIEAKQEDSKRRDDQGDGVNANVPTE